MSCSGTPSRSIKRYSFDWLNTSAGRSYRGLCERLMYFKKGQPLNASAGR